MCWKNTLKIIVDPVSVVWFSWFLGRVDSKRSLVDSWASTIQAYSVFLLGSVLPLATVSCGFLARFLISILHCMAASIETSSFFLAFLVVSVYSSSSGSMKYDGSQCSSVVELWFLRAPSLLLFLLSCFWHANPNFGWQIILVVAWIFVSLSLDHTHPWGGFFNNVNFVNPVHKPDEVRSTSTFQHSWIRFSCHTSRHVCVVLVTSIYFQWNWEWFFFRHVELNSRFNVMTLNEVSFHWPEVVPGFSIIFCFCRLRPLRVALRFSLTSWSRLGLDSRTSWSLRNNFAVPSGIGSMKFSPFFDVNTSFALSLRARLSDASEFPSSSLTVCNQNTSFPDFPPEINASLRNVPGKTFLPNWWSLVWSFAEIGWCSTIAPSGMTRPLNRVSEKPFMRCLPICQEILNVSQFARAFHRIGPPFFIQAWLQQNSRRPFSLSNPIRLGRMGFWSAMIPW